MPQPGTRRSYESESHILVSLHDNVLYLYREAVASIITVIIYLDHTNFIFAADVPSGAFCGS
jgi:hypothetical protein